ncbi:MAG: LptE family protein [Bacteroidales bacterium]
MILSSPFSQNSRFGQKMHRIWIVVIVILIIQGCKLTISTTDASISPETKTCSVQNFPNRALVVNPSLSRKVYDDLQDKIQSQTSLRMVNGEADVMFEGEITGYETRPAAITGQNVAALDRLTITIQVKFTNNKDPKFSYSKSFSRYADYSRNQSFASVENDLIDEIIPLILEDIFNAAFANW